MSDAVFDSTVMTVPAGPKATIVLRFWVEGFGAEGYDSPWPQDYKGAFGFRVYGLMRLMTVL